MSDDDDVRDTLIDCITSFVSHGSVAVDAADYILSDASGISVYATDALAEAEQRADTAERKVRAVEEELAEWDLAVEPDGSPALMPVRGGAAVLRTRIALASHDRSRVTGN